jgi:hypothetical protein
MSSDARIRFQRDGSLRGSHDGDCLNGDERHAIETKYDLSGIIADIERCIGLCAWEIQDSGNDDGPDQRFYLAGWTAR